MVQESESADLLSCPLCKNEYDTDAYVPYVASCGHNICVQCIPDIVKAECPTCHEPTFHKMDNNYLALELIYQMEQARNSLEEAKGIIPDTQGEKKDLYWREAGVKGKQPSGQTGVGTSASSQPRPQSRPSPQLQNLNLEPAQPAEEETPKTTMIEVFNIPPHWERPDIHEKFGLWGNARIMSCSLPRHQDGRSKGFARVTYEHAVSAEEAVFTLNDTDNGSGGKLIVKLKQKQIALNKAIKKGLFAKKFTNKTSIHISNLGHVTEEQLRDYFQKHGLVTAVRVCRDHFGHPTGNAILNYQFDHGAKMAIKYENGTYFPNSTQKMVVDPFTDN